MREIDRRIEQLRSNMTPELRQVLGDLAFGLTDNSLTPETRSRFQDLTLQDFIEESQGENDD